MKTLIIEFDDAFSVDELIDFLQSKNCSVKADVQTIHVPILSICDNPTSDVLPEPSEEPPAEVIYEPVAEPIIDPVTAGVCDILDLSVSLPYTVSAECVDNRILVTGLTVTELSTRFNIGGMVYGMPAQMQTICFSVKLNDVIFNCEFTPESCESEPSVIFSKGFYDQIFNIGGSSEVPAQ